MKTTLPLILSVILLFSCSQQELIEKNPLTKDALSDNGGTVYSAEFDYESFLSNHLIDNNSPYFPKAVKAMTENSELNRSNFVSIFEQELINLNEYLKISDMLELSSIASHDENLVNALQNDFNEKKQELLTAIAKNLTSQQLENSTFKETDNKIEVTIVGEANTNIENIFRQNRLRFERLLTTGGVELSMVMIEVFDELQKDSMAVDLDTVQKFEDLYKEPLTKESSFDIFMGYGTEDGLLGSALKRDTAEVMTLFKLAAEELKSRFQNTEFDFKWSLKPVEIGSLENEEHFTLYAFDKNDIAPVITDKEILDAQVSENQFGQIVVNVLMNSKGTSEFEELTRLSQGGYIAISFNDEVVSAPRVNEVIEAGSVEISGVFSLEEAKELANALQNPAYLPMKNLNTRKVERK